MTIENIKAKLKSNEYDFLRNNEKLGKKIILLTVGGSHAYGTNIETSDIDIRGCALNSKAQILTNQNFEQFVNEETDTTIYAFNKLISLLCNTNPNVIEMLGNKPEHYFYLHPIGQELINNSKLFLSKKAFYSFGGYASQQLRRLQNAISHDTYDAIQQKNHLKNTINSVVHHFNETYTTFDESAMHIQIKNGELLGNINLVDYPLKDFTNILNEITNITRDYEKYNGRNRKKDDNHLNKHAMHLIRLYLMGLDILEKGEINTYREHDKDMLLEIRNGKYMLEDGSYRPDFFEMVNNFEKRLDYAAKHTNLPDRPNYDKINEFVISVNERVVKGEFSN